MTSGKIGAEQSNFDAPAKIDVDFPEPSLLVSRAGRENAPLIM